MLSRRWDWPGWAPGSRPLGSALLGLLGLACAGGSGLAPGSSAPLFEYHGPSNWSITGWRGGPYANTSLLVVLGNPGPLPVEWSASSVPEFIALDQQSGSIAPNTELDIHANLLEPIADSFRGGLNSGLLAFHNESAAQPDTEIACSLWIDDPATATQLAPATHFVTSGPAAGPFDPPAAIYSLSNGATSTLNWQVSSAVPWLSVTPAAGELAPGASVDLSVAIEPVGTSALEQGLHESAVVVGDSSGTPLHLRSVFLNLTGDAPDDGWTQFTPSPDTRRVYVSSSSGDDSDNGLSEAHAKRTIAAGKARLRNGFPDWLLLKKGDSWDESLGDWTLSGRSASARMLVASYGDGKERPLLRSGSGNGVASNHPSNHIAIVGLHFWAHTFSGSGQLPRGVIWLNSTSNFLLEDCFIQGYETNIVMQGFPQPGNRHTNVAIRRNVIVDAFSTSNSNSEGLYASECDGLLIEENVIDHNGWVDAVPGSSPTIFRHNVYVQNGCTGVVFRGNIVAGTDGAQIRPGGIIRDNLVARCVCGLQVGVGDTPEPAGISATISSNVVIRGRSLDAAHPGIFGMRLSNLVGGSIDANIVAAADDTNDSRALWFSTINGYRGPVANDLHVTGNTCHDYGYLTFEGNETQYSAVVLEDNAFQNISKSSSLVHIGSPGTASPARLGGKQNTWWAEKAPSAEWVLLNGRPVALGTWLGQIGDTTSTARKVEFPDPRRDTGSYNASLGGEGKHEAFMLECRKQSRGNWRVQYTAAAANAYIREGFLRPHPPGTGGSPKKPR